MSRLLLVLAHPDDESMGNGTLIARAAARGVEVHLVCATRGGAGWNGLPEGRRPEELTAIRTEELAAAASVLGLAGVELWDYPDGGVPGCDQDEITARIASAVDRIDPTVVVGWGPDGGYGHPDHIAVGACTDRALAGSGRPQYHMATDQGMADAFAELVRRQGIDPGSMKIAAQPHVDAVFEPDADELELVRRAVRCHASQLNAMFAPLVADTSLFFWLARNCYIRVAGDAAEPAIDLLPELR